MLDARTVDSEGEGVGEGVRASRLGACNVKGDGPSEGKRKQGEGVILLYHLGKERG